MRNPETCCGVTLAVVFFTVFGMASVVSPIDDSPAAALPANKSPNLTLNMTKATTENTTLLPVDTTLFVQNETNIEEDEIIRIGNPIVSALPAWPDKSEGKLFEGNKHPITNEGE